MDVNAQMAGWVAGVLSVAGYIPYIWSIITGRTRSAGQLTAWLVWAIEYSVLFAVLVSAGDRDALWLPGAELAGTLVTAVLVYWRREPGIDWEWVGTVALLCGAALGVWMIVGNPYVGLPIVLAVDLTGIVLTVRDSYRSPHGELPEAWACWAAGGVAGAVAARHGGPLALVFPVFLAVTCAAVLVSIVAGENRRLGRHWKGAVVSQRVSDLVPAAGWDEEPLRRLVSTPVAPPRPPRRTGRATVSGITLAACAAVAALVFMAPPALGPLPISAGLHPAGPNRPAVRPVMWHARPVHRGTWVVLEKMMSPIGPVLADEHGRTLYRLVRGTCVGSCLHRFHPVMGQPSAAPGVHLTGRFGRTPRGQATYRGRPLWVFAGDHQPGDVGGAGFAWRWAVMPVTGVGPVVMPASTDRGS